MKESQATKIVRAIIFENKNLLSINAVRPRVVNSKRVLKKKQQPKNRVWDKQNLPRSKRNEAGYGNSSVTWIGSDDWNSNCQISLKKWSSFMNVELFQIDAWFQSPPPKPEIRGPNSIADFQRTWKNPNASGSHLEGMQPVCIMKGQHQ